MVGSKMPPRTTTAMTSSFSITDVNNEVVCPLKNQDGSSCRKKCLGEKRYRSMQEHIRRAHPEHYIPKLPATEESFLLMINSPPQERPNDQSPASATQGFRDRHGYDSGHGTPSRDMYSPTPNSMIGTASAAAVLAELHGVKGEKEYDGDGYHSDYDSRGPARSSMELPPLHQISQHDITSDPYSRSRALPALLQDSPPGRSSTLPPIHRITGPSRNHTISKRSKEMNHKRKQSRGSGADWLRRIQNDDRLRSIPMDRKALSMEPSTDFGKRWEDLIDAADHAASIAGDIEDRTPLPQSPVSITGGSFPPFSNQAPYNNYQASPLQQALTPPSYTQEEPFPSVESGDNFHMGARGLSASSPTFSSQNTQIYCAACQNASLLRNSYACTECICGFCGSCVEILMAEHGARRKCPRCATIGGRFKPFQLEIR